MVQTNDTPIVDVLRDIANGKIQLPDFQRGWVWDDDRIKSLIASISNSYPVGALMFLESGENSVRFKYRPFTGAPKVDNPPDILVLDGQQRLTSIFGSLYSKEPVHTKTAKGKEIQHYYYIDIEKAVNTSVDRIDAIYSISEDKMEKEDFGRKIVKDLSTREKEFAAHYFPLNIVYDSKAFMDWQMGYIQYHNMDSNIYNRFTKFYSDVLDPIQKFQVPVIRLAKETPKEAVCQVFENVNTGGVSLTVFELITATFAADNFELRKDWESRHALFIDKSRISQNPKQAILWGVSSTDFLTSLTLLTRYYMKENGGEAISCKKKDVLNLTLEEYQKYADDISYGYIQSYKFLVEQRIFTSNDIPYATQLIPLSAIFAILKDRAEDSIVKEKIARWYWCGVFGEMYGGANESRYARDVEDVVVWINGGEEPDTVKRSFFHPNRLLSLQSRLSAAYKGIMALILKTKCYDFVSGKEMDFSVFSDENIDIHHIFPRAYCESKKYDRVKWNSVVNKTPLSARTNRIIGGSAPSVYIGYLEKEGHHVSDKKLDSFIASHSVDVGDLRCDNFDDYFIKRAVALLDLIGNATGKPVTSRESDEVIKEFGKPLISY